MSKPIYLFQEHEKFQVGKTTLQKNVVFETNITWISFVLMIAIGLMALAGNSLRLQWRYNEIGQKTTGIVSVCDDSPSSNNSQTTYVEYHYEVAEKMYYGRDRIGIGRLCNSYQNGASYPVYYLSDAPEESGIGAFLHGDDWLESLVFAGVGIPMMIFVFYQLMKNRKEQYKHAFLQKHANSVIEADVIKVGRITGKSGYDYADYRFTSPDMGVLTGQIRSGRGYRWPKDIKADDTLHILYVNDETYCVL